MRPRVVYLDHCARLSGGELALLRLLRALRDVVDAHVVLAEDGPLVGELQAASVSTEVLALSRVARETRRAEVGLRRPPLRQSAHAAAYSLRLARRLRQLRPDLVHANSLKAIVCGSIAARLARIPLIWHVRDRIADDYLPPAAVRLVGLLARHAPCAVLANSYETLERLYEASGGSAEKLPYAVVYDPVDLQPKPQRTINGRPLRVGMLGRIAEWKGQHVFLEAFARAFPHGAERAIVVGAPLFGEETYEDELRRLAMRLGIAPRVEFAGHQADVAAQFADMDLLVHASVLPEPLGQVVQEGMRAGVPVVASRAGGPAEIVREGVTGFLYPPGDIVALARTLKRLAADQSLRERVGAAGVAHARAFAPERIAAQVMDLYRLALEG